MFLSTYRGSELKMRKVRAKMLHAKEVSTKCHAQRHDGTVAQAAQHERELHQVRIARGRNERRKGLDADHARHGLGSREALLEQRVGNVPDARATDGHGKTHDGVEPAPRTCLLVVLRGSEDLRHVTHNQDARSLTQHLHQEKNPKCPVSQSALVPTRPFVHPRRQHVEEASRIVILLLRYHVQLALFCCLVDSAIIVLKKIGVEEVRSASSLTLALRLAFACRRGPLFCLDLLGQA